jgi:hypothetical protein
VREAPDEVAPRAQALDVRCTRRRCTLRLRARDAQPSSGIARVEAWVCPGRRICTARRGLALVVRAAGAGRWIARTPRLARGTAGVALRATDRAGNRQAPLSRVRLRVR